MVYYIMVYTNGYLGYYTHYLIEYMGYWVLFGILWDIWDNGYYTHMGMSINSGMDRSVVIRTMDRECLRKVPDPYPFVRAHHSIQTVLILLLSPTCYYFSSCYSCC